MVNIEHPGVVLRRRIVFVFAGQGSQQFHMGADLFNSNALFRDHMISLDRKFQYSLGCSIIDYIYDHQCSKIKPFDDVAYSHPAIFMLEYSAARALIDQGFRPDALMGASLGEIACAVLSDSISLDEAVNLISRQVSIFAKYPNNGEMIVIFSGVSLFYDNQVIRRYCELISENSKMHFVVGGTTVGIEIVKAELQRIDISFQVLPVKQAFHTRSMDILQHDIDSCVKSLNIGRPALPSFSCTLGGILDNPSPFHFWQFIRNEIKISTTIKAAEDDGPNIYIDLSPSGTFANLLKYNIDAKGNSIIKAAFSPYGKDSSYYDEIVSLIKENNNKTSDLNAQQKLGGQLSQSQCQPDIQYNQQFLRQVSNAPSLVYVFPGQGSQRLGMGGDLFDEFQEYTEIANSVLGYSIKDLCIYDPNQQLAQTQYTQPALYVVNILEYLSRVKSDNRIPNCVAGHSLGEYCALFVAGVYDFETGLRLVKYRGELMSRAQDGGMAAVLGLDGTQINKILRTNNFDEIDVANYNSHQQIVLSGNKSQLNEAQQIFLDIGANFIPLNVSAAFHSRYMQPFSSDFKRMLASINFSTLKIPVIANINARPYQQNEIVHNLTAQLYSSVRWTDTVEYILNSGKSTFIEVGPGTVLTKLIGQIEQSRKTALEVEPL